ncbi:MAG: hypothetical protein HY026_01895 [Deltaproteobacteria bacterium]|nr:hypothetical protein [Deltaproteobacteria bacterium]
MDTSKVSSLLQMGRITGRSREGLTIVDYAFMLMRGIVVAGGGVWLIFHPYPAALKLWLLTLFLIFIVYSLIIHALILIWPQKVETIYLVCLSLDLIFTGLSIKLSGGLNSIVFLVIYPLVALHSFYYGFYRGVALAAVASFVYFVAVYDQWGILHWTDLLFRIAVIFIIAGFLGFIAEKERYDRDELVKTQLRLNALQKDLESAYKNLQDVKTQVEQSEKLASIGRLSAELAHEINNPLDGIKNCLAVIERDSEDTQLKKKYIELMGEAICDIENAVRNLLDYAKRHEPTLEKVDVTSILQRTIIMAEYKLQKTGIHVDTEFEDDLPHILGDPHQLQEVFFNIILNAIDAMPKGGRLTIEVRGIGNFVDIKIIDTGVGIPQEELANIFQPFYTTKPLGEGTGLGLPVSLDIVRKHHGTINVYSEVGIGSIFSITIPVAIKDQERSNIMEATHRI